MGERRRFSLRPALCPQLSGKKGFSHSSGAESVEAGKRETDGESTMRPSARVSLAYIKPTAGWVPFGIDLERRDDALVLGLDLFKWSKDRGERGIWARETCKKSEAEQRVKASDTEQ